MDALDKLKRRFLIEFGAIAVVGAAIAIAFTVGWMRPQEAANFFNMTDPRSDPRELSRNLLWLGFLACAMGSSIPVNRFAKRLGIDRAERAGMAVGPILLIAGSAMLIVWIGGSFGSAVELLATGTASPGRGGLVIVNPFTRVVLIWAPLFLASVPLPRLAKSLSVANRAQQGDDSLERAHSTAKLPTAVVILQATMAVYSCFLVASAFTILVVYGIGNGDPNPGVPDAAFVLLLVALAGFGLLGLATRRFTLRGSAAWRRAGVAAWWSYVVLGFVNLAFARGWCPFVWSWVSERTCDGSLPFFIWFVLVAVLPAVVIAVLLSSRSVSRFVSRRRDRPADLDAAASTAS